MFCPQSWLSSYAYEQDCLFEELFKTVWSTRRVSEFVRQQVCSCLWDRNIVVSVYWRFLPIALIHNACMWAEWRVGNCNERPTGVRYTTTTDHPDSQCYAEYTQWRNTLLYTPNDIAKRSLWSWKTIRTETTIGQRSRWIFWHVLHFWPTILSVAPLVQHVVCLSVCRLWRFVLWRNGWTDLREIFREAVEWPRNDLITF